MSRRLLIAVAALAVAVMGTVAVFAYARGADRRALLGQQAVSAYIVRKDVPAGTTAGKALDDGLIVKELVASKGVPEGALTDVDHAYEQLVATSDLQPGELVLRSRFGTQAAANGRLLVPDGRMAVSVSLDDASHVGGFVGVGSHIAVFDTFNVQEADKKSQTPAGDHLQDRHEFIRATRLLVPDVEVLAVGATTTKSSADPSEESQGSDMQNAASSSPTTTSLLVTLAVTQAEAQRVIHAVRTGTITFALLGPDGAATPGAGVDDRGLFTGIKP
jgi:pilus assembly protein CpaB